MKILLIAPPGLLTSKNLEIIGLNFDYKPSRNLKPSLIKEAATPCSLPLLHHVYTINDDLLMELPEILKEEPKLEVIVFGYTSKHVMNLVGPVKEGKYEGFIG